MKKTLLLLLLAAISYAFATPCLFAQSATDNPVVSLYTSEKNEELTLTITANAPIRVLWGGTEKSYTIAELDESAGDITGTAPDGTIHIYTTNNAIEKLTVGGMALTRLDLLGVEALTELSATGNELSEVNLEKCTALTYLNLSRNPLTSISLLRQEKLEDLRLDGCGLKQVDLTPCSNLKNLSVSGNALAALDLKLSLLESIDCSRNSLASGISFKACPALQTVKAKKCNLTSLDLSGLTKLTKLEASGNKLTAVKLKDNQVLSTIDLTENLLDACALDAFCRALPEKSAKTTYGKDLLVKNNPGAKTAKSDLAEEKRWTIDQKGDGSGCETALESIGEEPLVRAFAHDGLIWIVTPRDGYQIRVYDLMGRSLYAQMGVAGTQALEMALPSGTYLVSVQWGTSLPITQRIVL